MISIIERIKNVIECNDCIDVDSAMMMALHNRLKNNDFSKIGGVFARRRWNKLSIKYGCFIPSKCSIGSGIIFPHGLFGIFISQDAVIGNHCCIFQHVTIGSNYLEDSSTKGAPQIGDNVYIGTGAKIIGKCKVGNNVRIGANAVITKDIPDNVTVVGNGVRIIEHEELLNNCFIPHQ